MAGIKAFNSFSFDSLGLESVKCGKRHFVLLRQPQNTVLHKFQQKKYVLTD